MFLDLSSYPHLLQPLHPISVFCVHILQLTDYELDQTQWFRMLTSSRRTMVAAIPTQLIREIPSCFMLHALVRSQELKIQATVQEQAPQTPATDGRLSSG